MIQGAAIGLGALFMECNEKMAPEVGGCVVVSSSRRSTVPSCSPS